MVGWPLSRWVSYADSLHEVTVDAFQRRIRLIEALLAGPRMRQELLTELAAMDDEDDRGLTPSSISADVQALRELAFGFGPVRAGDKRTRQAYALDLQRLPLWASVEDAEAIASAAGLLAHLGLPQAAALERLVGRVPRHVRELMREPDYGRLLAPAGPPSRAEVVAAISRAVRTGSPMWIGYQAQEGSPRRHYVDRSYLTWHEGALYLHAHCPRLRETTKVRKNLEFRVDRIIGTDAFPAVEVLEGVPCVEPEFPHFELVLQVPAYFALRFVPIPGEVRVTSAPGGDKHLHIRESIPLRAVRRALSYGEFARVVEPAFVKDDLRASLARMYGAL